MQPNLAQICRWWVDSIIIEDSFNQQIFHYEHILPPSPPTSLHRDASHFDSAPIYSPPKFSVDLFPDTFDTSNLVPKLDGSSPTPKLVKNHVPSNTSLSRSRPFSHYPMINSKTLPFFSTSNMGHNSTRVTCIITTQHHPVNHNPTESNLPESLTNLSETQITELTCHKPFIAEVLQQPHDSNMSPTNAHQTFSAHLEPNGTPLPLVDHIKFLRVCVQNTQHSFQLQGDGIDMSKFIANIPSLGAQMIVPISPNVNWFNKSNWNKTKYNFRSLSQHIHLSAIPSDIGKHSDYLNTPLIGSSASITLGLWSSKVSNCLEDLSGYGAYCVTTIQGKNDKKKLHSGLYSSTKGLQYWCGISVCCSTSYG